LFAGKRIAWRDSSGNVYYYFADVLGSTRVVTNATGSTCFNADYYPYGQENDYTTTCSPTYKFTGYEFDSETGNYYAYARYYSPRLGRFLSADPMGGSGGNPQSLNGYSYVLNNSTTLTDPLGLSVDIKEACMAAGRQGGVEGSGAVAEAGCGYGPMEGGGGGGGGAGCTIDYSPVGCDMLGLLTNNASGVECPNEVCAGWSGGNFVMFEAGAGGAMGYMTMGQMAAMNSECGHSFCTATGYLLWTLNNNPQAAAKQTIQAAVALMGEFHLTLGHALLVLLNGEMAGFVQGGNINFSLSQAEYASFVDPSCGSCRLDDGLHFHMVDGGYYVHLDTVYPFGSVGGFFEHGFVDLFLGNFAYNLIPRPWP
jgi:RHS repeat-associated protein